MGQRIKGARRPERDTKARSRDVSERSKSGDSLSSVHFMKLEVATEMNIQIGQSLLYTNLSKSFMASPQKNSISMWHHCILSFLIMNETQMNHGKVSVLD